MRKIYFIVAFIFAIIISGTSYGQKKVYCEIIGWQKLMNPSQIGQITIDYGQKIRVFTDNRMIDDNGKAIKFNSLMDALNYMASKGWELVNSYVYGTNIHLVLAATIDENEHIVIKTKSTRDEDDRDNVPSMEKGKYSDETTMKTSQN